MKKLYDQLLGALVGLSRASESKEISKSAGEALAAGLAMAHHMALSLSESPVHPEDSTTTSAHKQNRFTSVAANTTAARNTTPTSEDILSMIDRLHKEKDLMAPDCAACQYPCGRTFDYEMEEVYGASEALRDAKLKLIQALSHIAVLSPANQNPATHQFLSDALFQISCTYSPDQLAKPLEDAAAIIKGTCQRH